METELQEDLLEAWTSLRKCPADTAAAVPGALRNEPLLSLVRSYFNTRPGRKDEAHPTHGCLSPSCLVVGTVMAMLSPFFALSALSS